MDMPYPRCHSRAVWPLQVAYALDGGGRVWYWTGQSLNWTEGDGLTH